MNVTIGDMAEALHQLKESNGLYYNPSKNEILEKAIQIKGDE